MQNGESGLKQSSREEAATSLPEEEWKSYLNAIPHPVLILDPTFTILSANNKVLQVLGKSHEEVLGRKCHELFHGTDSPGSGCPAEKLFSEGVAGTVEMEMETLNGTFLVSCTPMRDRSGNLLRILHMAVDITDQKKTQRALQESEERYRVHFENVSDVVYSIDRELRVLHVSPSVERAIGYRPEEIIGKPFPQLNILTPESLALAASHAQRILMGERIEAAQYTFISKDGTERIGEVSGSPLMSRDGEVIGIVSVARDVTDHKRAEEALRVSEETLRSLIDATTEALLMIDRDGRILAVNETFAQRFKKTKKDLVGSCMYDQFPPEVAEYRRAQNEKAILTGRPVLFEDKREGKSFISNIYPVFDKDKKVSKLAIFATDITQRERMEQERAQLESQLRQAQKMEAVGTLAGGIAHDFNNLLTVIIGYCSVLQMSMEDKDPLRVHIDPILSSSRKAADLISSLLAFSRQQPISLKPLDLNETIGGTEKLLERLLTEDIELATSLCPGEATIMADTIQIEQVLFNLATNARDAMRKGGTLTIETKLVELDRDFINAHGYGEPGGFVLLSVSDTGSGIDEAIKEKVFDPFFTTKEPGKGTGLGLSTVYGIVKQHNAYINVHSERGVGTTFQIYFPLVQEAARAEEQPSPYTGRGSETILVAEDNEDVRRLIKSILSKYGYRVIEASDGQDAIDQLKIHEDVDLVILDSVMPRKNGREVFDEISRTRPEVKAIFTSGYTRDIVLDKGIEAGKVNFISKPILPNELLLKVREVLDG
jgi:two-component system cell cycle sensor histidine kinase/response regulator CckA